MNSVVFWVIKFILWIHLLISAAAQSDSNVTVGSFLVANDANTSWVSPSGEFAFGFRRIVPGGGYLLAIWFNRIPEKTMVWSANPANPVEQGSRIQLSADGRFQLDDPRNQLIWAADSSSNGGSAVYAVMLDSGNFVLANSTWALVWQSFDHPTDTLLPNQRFLQGGVLFSSFSETNHSVGRFKFALETDGNLRMYTLNFPMTGIVNDYWSADSEGSGFQLIFNQSSYIYLVAENGTVLNSLSSPNSATFTSSLYYHRAIFELDGVLRHYIYPKASNSVGGRPAAWSVVSFLPLNICLNVGGDTSLGACGRNSLCFLGADQRPNCRCPDGYSPIDGNDRMSGCKPDFLPQSCDQESGETALFSFVDMPNTDFPGSSSSYFTNVSEDWCRESCLADCFCTAAVYRDSLCWKKKYPLSNGRYDPSLWEKALIKVRTNSSSNGEDNPTSDKHCTKSSTLLLTVAVVLGVLVCILFLAMALLFLAFHKRRRSKILQPAYSDLPQGVTVRSFSFHELEEATNGFTQELGRGAFSTVFKGSLKNENGKPVAVQRLNKMAAEVDKEFKAKVSSICRTNHRNLVQFLGYCDQAQNRLLVYEFMSNGSLADYIFSNSKPSWYTRVQIAYSTAKGLCYLHEDCTTQIIHCDIKPQNVLLDESHVAKIADFGLAMLLRPDQTITTTGIRGTRGELAPEWFRNVPITAKVDVYSFGILLLELVCCRRNLEPEEEILADWAYECYRKGEIISMVSGDEEAMGDVKRLEKFVIIAIWCIQEDAALRPNMKRVTQMLEGSVEAPAPPNPSHFC